MKKLFLILTVIFFQLTALTVSLSAKQHDKKALTSRIMELSGMNYQIRQMPALVQAGISSKKGLIPPDVYNILESESVKAFQPEKILKEVSSVLSHK